MDLLSKSDPCVQVYLHNGGHSDKWISIGETETVENNLNPIFVRAFDIDYYFEKNQKIKFEVYDIDLNSKEFIGSAETQISKIMSSKLQSLTMNLTKDEHKKGEITIKLEHVSTCNDMIYFTGKAFNLASKKSFFCVANDNPFFFVERTRSPESNEFIRVIQSEYVVGTTNPKWVNQRFSARKLCNGDENNRLKFRLYSWRDNGYHVPYGEFTTTLSYLKKNIVYDLFKAETKIPIPKCQFEFDRFKIEKRPSFFDFLKSGWQINL